MSLKPAASPTKPLRRLTSALAVMACFTSMVACSGARPKQQRVAQPLYHLDNSLEFQPKRIWRVIVKWEPYLLDSNKAVIQKEFQLIAHDERERKRIEGDILARGGDELYLNWLESNFLPIGVWEKRDTARVARYHDMLMIVVTTKAFKEVTKKGRLAIAPLLFPDPTVTALRDACAPESWDVLPKDDMVGLEIVLETKSDDPTADKWQRTEVDLPNFSWKAWSVATDRQMAYRQFIHVKANISRCPLPPEIHKAYVKMSAMQPMGVDW